MKQESKLVDKILRTKIRSILLAFTLVVLLLMSVSSVSAATRKPTITEKLEIASAEADLATPSATNTVTPEERPVANLTTENKETVEPLIELLDKQKLGSVYPFNFLKYAIRGAVASGVPANTLVLLILLPGVATIIAAARHLVGLRGFGIFLPAALSIVFLATGPIVGIGLFLVIVVVSTFGRIVLRKSKIKLQYLPRMSFILLLVVLGIMGILFMAPLIGREELAKVSIFPVLILVLLSEEFSRVQLGKSAQVAINLATETLILSLLSYIFLALRPVHELALLNPEAFLLSVAIIDLLIGKYVGLRLVEYWRFRKLIWG